jgi:hypothetical protein
MPASRGFRSGGIRVTVHRKARVACLARSRGCLSQPRIEPPGHRHHELEGPANQGRIATCYANSSACPPVWRFSPPQPSSARRRRGQDVKQIRWADIVRRILGPPRAGRPCDRAQPGNGGLRHHRHADPRCGGERPWLCTPESSRAITAPTSPSTKSRPIAGRYRDFDPEGGNELTSVILVVHARNGLGISAAADVRRMDGALAQR